MTQAMSNASIARRQGGDWQFIGGATDDAPAAVFVPQRGSVNAFVRVGDRLRQYLDYIWAEFGAPPVGATEAPAAVLRGPEPTYHVAVRGADARMYQRYFDGLRWSEWENRGGELASGPALASWNPGRLDAFALGVYNNLIHAYWEDGAGWSQWEDLGARLPIIADIAFAPAAVSWGNNRIDVFAVGLYDGHLLHCYWDGSVWCGWEDLGGALTAAPTVISRGYNQLDVFARGSDNTVYHRGWNGARWSGWLGFAGQPIASAPGAIYVHGQIRLYARGADGALWWRDGSFVP